ncbi:hypothetical protein GRF29_106g1270860 [Pseudopithomyces chartarum]|uniref:Uncharacterized protein n=1 Tax=Pseudopithomyces chartarum TaxID=1892770 RepID=A0AAN6RED4_9PLEO|nr:hypothetical protein GRF29_106g1270860 [Pseudopithomyces chartarum]
MRILFEISRSGLTIQLSRSDRNTNKGATIWSGTGHQSITCTPIISSERALKIDYTNQDSRAYAQLEREVPSRKCNSLRNRISGFRKPWNRGYGIDLIELPGNDYNELPQNTTREDLWSSPLVNEGPQQLSLQTRFNEIGRTTRSQSGTTRVSPTITRHQIRELPKEITNHPISAIEHDRLLMPEDQIPNEGVCSPNMNTFWPSTPSQFSPSHSQTLFFNPNIPHDLCHPSVNRDDHGFLSYEADNRRSHAIHEDSGSIRVPLQHHGLQNSYTYRNAIHYPDPPSSLLSPCGSNQDSNSNTTSIPPNTDTSSLLKATASNSNTVTPSITRYHVFETPPSPLPFDHCGQTFTGKYQRGNLRRHTKNCHPESDIFTTDKTNRVSRQDLKRSDARKNHEWRKHRVPSAKPTAHEEA